MTPAREISRLSRIVLGNGEKEAFCFRLKNLGINANNVELLYKIYKLCTATDYVDELAREVFVGKRTYQQIAMNRGITLHKINYYVNKNTRKITKDLGGLDIIGQMIDNTVNQADYDKINKRVDELLVEHKDVNVKDIEDEFTFNFFDGVKAQKHELSEDEFVHIRSKVMEVSKKHQKFAFSNVNEKFLEYVVYLLKSDENKLDEEDKKRRANIIRISKIGEDQ